MPETVDYTAVLADLVRRRDDLDKAISALSAVVGGSTRSVEAEPVASRAEAPREVRSDAFFNMKAPEAIRGYLDSVRRPQAVKEIQDALLAGGFRSDAKDLYNNLYVALLRLEKDGSTVRVHGKWGLTEWYPQRPKSRPRSTENDGELSDSSN